MSPYRLLQPSIRRVPQRRPTRRALRLRPTNPGLSVAMVVFGLIMVPLCINSLVTVERAAIDLVGPVGAIWLSLYIGYKGIARLLETIEFVRTEDGLVEMVQYCLIGQPIRRSLQLREITDVVVITESRGDSDHTFMAIRLGGREITVTDRSMYDHLETEALILRRFLGLPTRGPVNVLHE